MAAVTRTRFVNGTRLVGNFSFIFNGKSSATKRQRCVYHRGVRKLQPIVTELATDFDTDSGDFDLVDVLTPLCLLVFK